jgi:hypothetical protein
VFSFLTLVLVLGWGGGCMTGTFSCCGRRLPVFGSVAGRQRPRRFENFGLFGYYYFFNL